MNDDKSDEITEQFLDFGALGYTKQKIASVLAIDTEEAAALMVTHEKCYQTGRDRFDYAVDKKLMELATKGDTKALDRIRRDVKARRG